MLILTENPRWRIRLFLELMFAILEIIGINAIIIAFNQANRNKARPGLASEFLLDKAWPPHPGILAQHPHPSGNDSNASFSLMLSIIYHSTVDCLQSRKKGGKNAKPYICLMLLSLQNIFSIYFLFNPNKSLKSWALFTFNFFI